MRADTTELKEFFHVMHDSAGREAVAFQAMMASIVKLTKAAKKAIQIAQQSLSDADQELASREEQRSLAVVD